MLDKGPRHIYLKIIAIMIIVKYEGKKAMSVDVKYRTRATATGGRDGEARSEDGRFGSKCAASTLFGRTVCGVPFARLIATPERYQQSVIAVTGFLGAYTTVSSFSLQTLSLARDGEETRAALYVVISVALALSAATLGFALVDALK